MIITEQITKKYSKIAFNLWHYGVDSKQADLFDNTMESKILSNIQETLEKDCNNEKQ